MIITHLPLSFSVPWHNISAHSLILLITPVSFITTSCLLCLHYLSILLRPPIPLSILPHPHYTERPRSWAESSSQEPSPTILWHRGGGSGPRSHRHGAGRRYRLHPRLRRHHSRRLYPPDSGVCVQVKHTSSPTGYKVISTLLVVLPKLTSRLSSSLVYIKPFGWRFMTLY